MPRAVVTGSGGFIGGHLVKRLLDEGYDVRAVDIKAEREWHQLHKKAENIPLSDLSQRALAQNACRGVDEVYNLAADMGGMGFIETHKYECMRSVLINTHMLHAAIGTGVKKYFFASSACVYPGYIQNQVPGKMSVRLGKVDWSLKESNAYPADPEDGYGWEKLFSERMCRHAMEDRGLQVAIGRYHNVYGPHGTWEGGREKAPAALCRKIAQCAITGKDEIEIWGDGEQTRSFMYIDDCIEGTRRLMKSGYTDPVNIGSSELVSINQLAAMVEDIARWHRWDGTRMGKLTWVYDLNAPQGVRGRNSDNTVCKNVLGWEPKVRLREGLRQTYEWIYEQVLACQNSVFPGLHQPATAQPPNWRPEQYGL